MNIEEINRALVDAEEEIIEDVMYSPEESCFNCVLFDKCFPCFEEPEFCPELPNE